MTAPSQKLVAWLVFAIIVIVLVEGFVGMAAAVWGVQEWNLPNTICGHMSQLGLVLAGGVIGYLKSPDAPSMVTTTTTMPGPLPSSFSTSTTDAKP